jgi:hypothetical protein
MRLEKILDVFFLICMAGTLVAGVIGCSTSTPTPSATTPGGPGTGEVINSDSIITATIKAIRQESTGYPWEIDILVNTSASVGDLPNPTKDSIGKIIMVKTDENLAKFKAGDNINARVKYTGDVPRPGITMYMYSVTLQQTTPGY